MLSFATIKYCLETNPPEIQKSCKLNRMDILTLAIAQLAKLDKV